MEDKQLDATTTTNTTTIKKRLPGIPNDRLEDIVNKAGGKICHRLDGRDKKVCLDLGRVYFEGDTNSELIENVFSWVIENDEI